ncbi:MAG: TolC family protein [Saprospiraceae bacterium]
MIRLFLIGFMAFSSIILYSQLHVSLEEAITSSLANSRLKKTAILNNKSIELDIAGLNSVYFPQINLSHNSFYTNDPLNAFGFKLQQEAIQTSDFNPSLLNNPDNFIHFNSKIALNQVLLKYDIFETKKALKSQLDANAWNTLRIDQGIILEVKNSYLELQFQYEALKITKKLLDNFKENERIAFQNFESGILKRTDIQRVQLEAKKLQNKILEFEKSIENLSAYLSLLMGKKLEAAILPMDRLQALSDVEISTELENRPDFQSMRSLMLAKNQMLKAEKLKALPQINGFGEYNIYDPQLFSFDANAYQLGIQLRWTIFDGNHRRNNILKIQNELNKLQHNYEQDLDKSAYEVAKQKNEIELNKSHLNLSQIFYEQWVNELKQMNDRYTQGLETYIDVINLESKVLESQINNFNRLKEYNKSINILEFLASTNK